MYKNIFITYPTETEPATVHLWDDKEGYMSFGYSEFNYAYIPDEKGKYISIFGDKLKKVRFSRWKENMKWFESDVPKETRVLTDLYLDHDDISTGHRIGVLDIETLSPDGFPVVEEANNTINAISFWDSVDNHYYSFFLLPEGIVREDFERDDWTAKFYKTEISLLEEFVEWYRTKNYTILTGWNCLPITNTVWLNNKIIQLKDLKLTDNLYKNDVIKNISPIREKYVSEIHMDDKKCISATEDHRFPILLKNKDKYSNTNSLISTRQYSKVSDIKELLNDSDVYFELSLRENRNANFHCNFSDEIFYVLGLLYTDGSLWNRTWSFYNKEKNLHDEFLSITNNLCSRRIVKDSSNLKLTKGVYRTRIASSAFNRLDEFIHNGITKELNLELLSQLSSNQFNQFLAGLIDGDGSVRIESTNIQIAIGHKRQADKLKLIELLLWNGIYGTDNNYTINILQTNNYSRLKQIPLRHKIKANNLTNFKEGTDRKSSAKNKRMIFQDGKLYVRIKEVLSNVRISDTLDIETGTHEFVSGGIQTHNCDNFDIPYLYRRIYKIFGQHTANMLSSVGIVRYSMKRERYQIAGVSCLDYLKLYKRYNYTEKSSYRLDAIATDELGRGKVKFEMSLDDLWKKEFDTFVKYNLEDVTLVKELNDKLKFINLVQNICHVGHVPYEDYEYSSRFIEGTIITYLHRKGIICPNCPAEGREMMERGDHEARFAGAYVRPPKPGLYEWVYSLDLQSLYPSILMSLNVSPETKIGKVVNFDIEKHTKKLLESYTTIIDGKSSQLLRDDFMKKIEEEKLSISTNGILYTNKKTGIIPEILDTWFSQRVQFKKLMKEAIKAGDIEKEEYYDKRQHVQKILLNSVYGTLALPIFRFFDLDNALAVTATGQDVIKSSVKWTNLHYKKYNTERSDFCIYIDTDSLYFSSIPLINTEYNVDKITDVEEFTIKLARDVENNLNKFYNVMAKRMFNCDKHRFVIKGESIAKTAFWVAKKRYALNKVFDLETNTKVEKTVIKGLDIVRSTFPKDFKILMKTILDKILKKETKNNLDTLLINYYETLGSKPWIDIARSISVKDISKYDEPNEVSLVKFVKKTPMHVKSAIIHNRLLKYWKLNKKFVNIKNKDKIKYVYLKDNPLQIQVLALKGYDDPKEFIEFIDQYVDVRGLFDSELKKKLKDFYSALGWGELPMDQNQHSKEFFSWT